MNSSESTAVPDAPRGIVGLWPYALLIAVGIFVLVPQLGSYGFWDPWEPKYAESAREMIERGDYIVPYYRHEVRMTKPILVYWGILSGSIVFGLNEFGARIPGVCLALATLGAVFYAVSRVRGRLAGILSGLVLATVPQFGFISRQAMPDVYLFTSVGMCLLFFALGMFLPDKRRNLHFGLSYACMGLALLAKGPLIIGAVFLTTLAIWTVIRVDVRELWLPARRGETLLFGLSAFPAAIASGFLAFTAYLFGMPPLWWGYSESSRQETALMRGQIEDTFERARLAEILLVLVVLGGSAAAYLAFKRSRESGGPFLARMALPAIGVALAFVGILSEGGPARIFAASALTAAACVYLIVVSTWRFLAQDWLWPILQPYLKQIGRQLLLFAVVFGAVAGPWHLAILISQSHEYMTDFIIKHNITRATDSINRSGDSTFYFHVLIFGYFPWSCFLPLALGALVGWWGRNPLKRHAFEIFLMIACAVTFTAFTISATKFTHYLSPMLVPLSVLIGIGVAHTLEERHAVSSRVAWVVASMLFVVGAMDLRGTNGASYMIETFTMKSWVPETAATGSYVEILLAVAAACVIASIVVRSRVLVAGLVATAALMSSYYTTQLVPELSRHKTMKHLCETWKREAPAPDTPIGFYGDIKHGVFFYTDYRVEVLRSRSEFEEFINPERSAYSIVEREMLPTLQSNHRKHYPRTKLHVADNSHFSFVLIRNFTE